MTGPWYLLDQGFFQNFRRALPSFFFFYGSASSTGSHTNNENFCFKSFLGNHTYMAHYKVSKAVLRMKIDYSVDKLENKPFLN